MIVASKQKNQPKVSISLRARKGAAITWWTVRICDWSQEIPTACGLGMRGEVELHKPP